MSLSWHIDWYALYGSAVNIASLSDIMFCHTDVLFGGTAAALAAETAASQRNVVFVDVVSERPQDNSAALDNGGDVHDNAPFPLHLASAARCIYGVSWIRPRQVETISRLWPLAIKKHM